MAGFTFDGSYVVGGSDEGKYLLCEAKERQETNTHQEMDSKCPMSRRESMFTPLRRLGRAPWWRGRLRGIVWPIATWGY